MLQIRIHRFDWTGTQTIANAATMRTTSRMPVRSIRSTSSCPGAAADSAGAAGLPQVHQAVPVTPGAERSWIILGESGPRLWVSLAGLRGAAERPGACWHGMQTWDRSARGSGSRCCSWPALDEEAGGTNKVRAGRHGRDQDEGQQACFCQSTTLPAACCGAADGRAFVGSPPGPWRRGSRLPRCPLPEWLAPGWGGRRPGPCRRWPPAAPGGELPRRRGWRAPGNTPQAGCHGRRRGERAAYRAGRHGAAGAAGG